MLWIGEIAVRGDIVTAAYYERHVETALAKIADDDGFWHRMGDLGWRDKKGRIWFCGRKSHRVVTAEETLFTIPCEAIFNAHPGVYRSALVGVGPAGQQQPVICIEYCTLWDEELLSDYLDEWICPWYKPGESLFRFGKLRWLYRLYLWVYRRLVRLRYGDWRKRWGCFPPPC